MIVNLIIGSLMIGSVYGMLALGYSLIYSASGLMTFTQGQLLMLGAFLGLQFYKNMGMPFMMAFLLTVVIMFLLGLALEKFLIRLLLNKGATSIYIVLSTIGVSIILPNLAQAIWGSQTQQMPSIFSTTTVEIFGAHVQPESILVMVVGFAAMILLHLFMTKSRFGISMRAAAMDPLAASSLGINVSRTTGLTWAIAAALAGGIGALMGPVYGVSTTMGRHHRQQGLCWRGHRRLRQYVRRHRGLAAARIHRDLCGRLSHNDLQGLCLLLPADHCHDLPAEGTLQGKGL